MDERLHCIVPGRPTAYARARHSGRHHWKPKKHEQWERLAVAHMRAAARDSQVETPLGGPVAVKVVAVHPRPKRTPKSAPLGRLRRRTATNDLDNVVKLALDAAVKAGWLVDDREVFVIHAERWHAAVSEGPSVRVTAWRLDDAT